MAIGEAAEQQVALQAASIPAPVEQALAADGDRFGHHGGCDLGGGRMAKDVANSGRISNTGLRAARAPASRRPPTIALRPLLAPVRTLRGRRPEPRGRRSRAWWRAGRRRARCLDLLWHLPHGVVERRLQTDAAALVEGERVTLLRAGPAAPAGPPPRRRPRARAGRPTGCDAGPGPGSCIWSSSRRARPTCAAPCPRASSASSAAARPLRRATGRSCIPELIAPPEQFARTGPLQPLYPLTQGLGQRRLGRCIARGAGAGCRRCRSGRTRLGWDARAGRASRRPATPAPAGGARPTSRVDAPARRRLAYDELLASQLALGLVRSARGPRARAARSSATAGCAAPCSPPCPFA